ncbi:unnamed protein product, partial [marine sediment metagenome]
RPEFALMQAESYNYILLSRIIFNYYEAAA